MFFETIAKFDTFQFFVGYLVWIPLYSVVWENIYSGVIKLHLFSPRYGQTQGYNLYNYLVLKHM